jgi:hypothetical protein
MPLALVTLGANRVDKSPTSIAADGGDGAFSPLRQPEVGGSIPTRGNSSPPVSHFFSEFYFLLLTEKLLTFIGTRISKMHNFFLSCDALS